MILIMIMIKGVEWGQEGFIYIHINWKLTGTSMGRHKK
jgi:hypothetical protein